MRVAWQASWHAGPAGGKAVAGWVRREAVGDSLPGKRDLSHMLDSIAIVDVRTRCSSSGGRHAGSSHLRSLM